MAQFRLLHISDLHLATEPNVRLIASREDFSEALKSDDLIPALRPSTYLPAPLYAAAEFAKKKSDASKIDIIVVSGDSAATGEAAELEVAQEFVLSAASSGFLGPNAFPTLQAANKPIFLIPGNHDRYAGTNGNPGAVEFDSVFGLYWPEGLGGVLAAVYRDDMDKRFTLSLIGADFCLHTEADAEPVPRLFRRAHIYGQGIARSNTLQVLRNKTTLARQRHPNTFVVWVIHFPPLPYRDPCLNLVGHAKVREAAQELNVPLILCGHIHENAREELGSGAVWSAGSACCADSFSRNWVHIVNISINEGLNGRPIVVATRTNYLYESVGAFDFAFNEKDTWERVFLLPEPELD